MNAKSGNRLLLDEPPLLIQPALAVALGLNQAIVLQQLHYWLKNVKVGKMHNGRKWVYNSIKNWRDENFPFWSEATIDRAFGRLVEMGIVLTDSLNRAKFDRTKWYAIDYHCLDEVLRQSGTVRSHYDNGNVTSRVHQIVEMEGITSSQPIPETTTETTTESAYSVVKDGSELVRAYTETFSEASLTAHQVEVIKDTVDDLGRWRAVLSFWRTNNYSPKNISDLLDRYGKWDESSSGRSGPASTAPITVLPDPPGDDWTERETPRPANQTREAAARAIAMFEQRGELEVTD